MFVQLPAVHCLQLLRKLNALQYNVGFITVPS